jgi:hypothetical protein
MNTDNIVTNRLRNNKLIRLFLNNFFQQNDQSEYHHFTPIDVIKSIVIFSGNEADAFLRPAC